MNSTSAWLEVEWRALSPPCPLRDTYQLARNILAACIKPDGTADDGGGHALVIYDERNPAYQRGGDAERQWESATEGLRDPGVLRRCSWQRLATHLASDSDMTWLVHGLADKYGIVPPE